MTGMRRRSIPPRKNGVAMAYRDLARMGTKDARTFNLYSYHFALNAAKVVQSLTLPNDSDVVVLAATLN